MFLLGKINNDINRRKRRSTMQKEATISDNQISFIAINYLVRGTQQNLRFFLLV